MQSHHTHPEILQNSPTNKPSTLKVETFRKLLQERWKNFEEATLEEAGGNRKIRDADGKYLATKSQLEKIQKILDPIQSDDELEENTKLIQQLDEVNTFLHEYLIEADTKKSYNKILKDTKKDLENFRKSLHENPSPTAKEAQIPSKEISIQKEVSTKKPSMAKRILEFFGFDQNTTLTKYANAWKQTKSENFFESIAGKAKVFFYGIIAMLFGVNVAKTIKKSEQSNAKTPKNTPSKASQKQKIEKSKEKGETMGIYNIAYTGLMSLHYPLLKNTYKDEGNFDRAKSRVAQVFTFKKFQDLPYSTAKKLYNTYKSKPDHPDLLKKVLSQDAYKDITSLDVFAALNILVNPELSSSKFLKKEAEKIKDSTIYQILSHSSNDLSIFSDIPKLQLRDPISAISGVIKKKFSISKNENEWKFADPEMQKQAVALGINATILLELVPSKINITKLKDRNDIEKRGLSKDSKVFLEKLLGFWGTIKQTLIQDFSFGQKEAYKEYYNNAEILPVSLLKLYLATEGKTDISTFSGPKKVLIYGVIGESFFSASQTTKNKGATLFNKSLINEIKQIVTNPDDIDSYISKDTQEVMRSIFLRVGENYINDTLGDIQVIWNSLPTEGKVALGVGIGALAVVWYYSRVFQGIAIGATTALASTIAAKIYTQLSEEDQKNISEKQIKEALGIATNSWQ